MKRILFLLAVLVSLCHTSVYAQADYGNLIIGDFKVILYNDEALIYEYMGNSAAVVIPSSYILEGKTYQVTEILSSAFEGNTSIQTVVFPENLRTIEFSAFSGCTNLWRLHFPETLTEIEPYAFEGLKNLQTVVLPNSELVIGYRAFSKCEKLSYVLIPEKVKSIGQYVFSGSSSINTIFGLGTTGPEMEYHTFSDIGCNPTLYYPKGYVNNWLKVVNCYLISRTEPAVCLDMISASTFVGAQGKVVATAYGYLDATIDSMEWGSSNTSVVTVDQDGSVTAVGPGITEVYCTVTDSNGETASATCTFQVKESTGVETVMPESVDIVAEYFTLQGLRAGTDRSALAPGIYIRRQGANVTKIVVK